jgi:hypothetical protein
VRQAGRCGLLCIIPRLCAGARPRISEEFETRCANPRTSSSAVLTWPKGYDERKTRVSLNCVYVCVRVFFVFLFFVTGMVLFRPSEPPQVALDRSTPRLLRMAPLRHSLRLAPRLDARDTDDTASTLSAPGCGEEDGQFSGECTSSECD